MRRYNVTVFAYGATGSGKTHTMMGNTRYDGASNNGEAGIIPNALIDIFKLISTKRSGSAHGESWLVTVSFMEVYNEQVYDLLESTGKVLSLREDQDKGVVYVAGIAGLSLCIFVLCVCYRSDTNCYLTPRTK